MAAAAAAVGSGQWETTVLTAVKGKRAASSSVVVGDSEAIVGGQLVIAGERMLVGGRIIYYQNCRSIKVA